MQASSSHLQSVVEACEQEPRRTWGGGAEGRLNPG